MARIRYIKPEFPEDVKLAEVSRDVRLLYACLWCWMDRQGITEDEPRIIKKNIFPYDDDVSVERVSQMIDELCSVRRLIRITHNGMALLFCPGFQKHQKFHPGETPKYRISEKVLYAATKTPADQLLEGFNEPAKSTLTGTGTGTGIGIGTGMGTGEGAEAPDVEDTHALQAKLEAARVRAGLTRDGKTHAEKIGLGRASIRGASR